MVSLGDEEKKQVQEGIDAAGLSTTGTPPPPEATKGVTVAIGITGVRLGISSGI